MITRRRLDVALEPVDVLRRLRGRDRVAAVLGDWHQGEALIACDPVEVLTDEPFAIDAVAGWLLGAWGYRLGGTLERLPAFGHRPVPQPEFRLARYEAVLRLVDGSWFVEHLDGVDPRPLLGLLADPAESRSFAVGRFAMEPTAEVHRQNVERVLEHIAAGDIFQVNLCARFEAPFDGDPLDVFCAGIEALAPAYAAFVAAPEGAVVSFSPELFLRRTGDEVLTSPIKGTAPLDSDVRELVASAKNRAENVMIVDLMRNDLGRVSTPGTVRVPALVRPERHAVWHLVSDVVGHVGHDVSHESLLRATFPPGSVTGAPKVRAMEIAAALEPTSREAYTGAIGHLSPDGTLELNVAIRTFEIAAGRIWLGVGGGIVADSTPHGEYDELLVKARPLIDAIGGSFAEAPAGPVVAKPEAETAADDLDTAAQAPPTRSSTWPVDVSRGVFTTLLVLDGEPVDLEAHIARLDASVRSIFGTTVRAGLEEAVRRKAKDLAGRQRLRVDASPVGDDIRVSLSAAPLRPASAAWRLVPRTMPGGLGGHKWADRDRIGAPADPSTDPLLIDTDGSVLETGRANVFLVLDDGVHTPPLDGRILPGTTRARVVEQLDSAGIPVLQHRLTLDDVARASEVFVSNTLRGVVPIIEIDGVGTWSAGPLAQALIDGRLHAPPRTRRQWPESPTVLFIDNYDSFVYNLVQYVRELGAHAEVVRNDAASLDELVGAAARGDFTHLVVSPGPGAPAAAGVSVELIARLGPTVPTLGVCLGHQAIGEAYGAAVVRAPEIVHGRPSLVHHDGHGVYAGLPSPLTCARYHSLIIDEATLPPELSVTARTASGIVMGVRHATHPVEGVQMHPESILTTHGHDMLTNFLSRLG